MVMNVKEYKNKVRGCWLGKNIGGTLGAPFEGKRGVFEIEGYTHDLSQGVLPNDDLDLQLVWLNAAEKYGRNVDAKILADYWIPFVVADWAEYGGGKNNIKRGISPPLSGWYNNTMRDSCGCFIRSEIWACLAPGHPEIAVQYAFEDASVDHSADGLYAEIFCAAVQSAAFAESDINTLIDIGLSYIPADCGVTLAVNTARGAHKNGDDWKAARKKVLKAVPGTFGLYAGGYEDREPEPDIPFGEFGYDAPGNIGIIIIGWLYGEGDLRKSLCIAAGCGEDGDCTCATLGAIMGIISGADKLPKDLLDPIGDEIKTISLNLTDWTFPIPKTITQLTDRVCNLMPVFMGNYCDTMNEDGVEIMLNKTEDMYDREKPFHGSQVVATTFCDKLKTQPHGISVHNVLFDTIVNCVDGINVKPNTDIKFEIRFKNNMHRQQWLNCRLIMPCDWTASTGREFSINLDQGHCGYVVADFETVINPGEDVNQASYDVVLEVTSNGYLNRTYVPIKLFNNPQKLI